MDTNWLPIIGPPLEQKDGTLIFKGRTIKTPEGAEQAIVGLYVCNQTFTGGSISVRFRFIKVSPASGAEIILYFDPLTQNTLNAGIPANSYPLLCVREFKAAVGKWNFIGQAGDRMLTLSENHDYELKVTLF